MLKMLRMRTILGTFALLLLGIAVQAQTPICKPDTTLADTLFGVFPVPYSTTNPLGGIRDTACINTPFEFAFTLKVPSTFTVAGTQVPVTQASLATTGAVKNLPTGLTYACDPPNCVFLANTSGCILLSGTPTDPTQVGQIDLQITGSISSFITIPVTFPDASGALFPPGNYFLYLRPQGSPACTPSSTQDLAATRLQLSTQPNPFTDLTEVSVVSELRGNFDFRVFDMTGRMVHRAPVQIVQGINRFTFDGSQLPPGLYVYSLTDGISSIARKMVKE